MQDRVFKNPKIEVLFEHNAVGLTGNRVVQGANLIKRMGEGRREGTHRN